MWLTTEKPGYGTDSRIQMRLATNIEPNAAPSPATLAAPIRPLSIGAQGPRTTGNRSPKAELSTVPTPVTMNVAPYSSATVDAGKCSEEPRTAGNRNMPVTAKMFCTVITDNWRMGTRSSNPTLSAGAGVGAMSHLLP